MKGPSGMTRDRYVTRTETIIARLEMILSQLQWVYEISGERSRPGIMLKIGAVNELPDIAWAHRAAALSAWPPWLPNLQTETCPELDVCLVGRPSWTRSPESRSGSRARSPEPGRVRIPAADHATAIRRYPIKTLPHRADDHVRAARGRRSGWRTPHDRRHLVPWAQEAERIGIPPTNHGRGPGRGKARDQRDVAIEVLRRRKPQPQR